MASYHCSVKTGSRGIGAAHADYIAREGRYASLSENERREGESHAAYIERIGKFAKYEDLAYKETGNLPSWATSSQDFWRTAEEMERANGRIYAEIEVALPNELTREQQIELVKEFIKEQIGERHVYTVGIHDKPAALNPSEKNVHAHIMFSERINDGIERGKNEYFKRYNSKHPERGGCKKDDRFTGDNKRENIRDVRAEWAAIQNKYLERYGHEARVDHRNLEDQKIAAIERGDIEKAKELNREPERHLGPKVAQKTIREVKKEMAKGQTKEEKIELRKQYYQKETTLEKSQQASLARQYKKDYNELQKDKRELDVERIRQNVPIREMKPETALKYAHQVFLRKAEKQIAKEEIVLGQQRRNYDKALKALAAAMKKNPENVAAHMAEKERLDKWRSSVEKKEAALQQRKEQILNKQIPEGAEKQVGKIADAILEKDKERVQKLHEAAQKLGKESDHKVTLADLAKMIAERQKTIPGELQKAEQQKDQLAKRIITKESAQAVAISVYTKGENKRIAAEQKRINAERQRKNLTPEEKQKLLSQIQSYNAKAGQLSQKVNSPEGREEIRKLTEKIMQRNRPYQGELAKAEHKIDTLKTEQSTLRELERRIPSLDKKNPIEHHNRQEKLSPGNVAKESRNLVQNGNRLLQNRQAAHAPKGRLQARIADDDEPTKKRGMEHEI